MDQSTQKNVTLTEQGANSAAALYEQAGRLSQVVSVFRLKSMPARPDSVVDLAPAPSVARIAARPHLHEDWEAL